MPRAYDKYPSQRTNADHNPLANLLNWQDATAQSAQAAGGAINNGITTGAGASVTAAFDSILSDLGIPTDGDVTSTSAFSTWLSQLDTDVENLLEDPTSANFDALINFLFGTNVSPSATISGPSVTNTPQSAQPVSNFPNAASIQVGGAWSYDATVTYTDPLTGITSGGSPKFAASGVPGATRGVVIPVQSGQVVTLAAKLKWSGLTVSGSNQIQLQLIPWSGVVQPDGTVVQGTAGTPIVVAQMTPFGSLGGWTGLTGAYTVPDDGVAFVQMRLAVTANATAGSIWWATCTTIISGGYIATIDALAQQLNTESQAAAAATQTFFQSLGTAVTNDSGNLGQFWTDAGAAAKTWWSAESGIAEEELVTIEQLADAALGISSATNWLMPALNVQGVGGFENLEDTIINTYNQLGAALGGDVADAGGLAWLAQLMNDIGVNSSSPLWPFISITQSNNQALSVVNNQPVSAGLEATVESNGDYASAASLSGAQVAKTTSRGTCITISQPKTLGFIQWFGSYTSALTGFVINFYKMDSSGNLTYLFSSPDLSATVASSGAPWYIWDLSTPIDVLAGDVIGVEFQIKTGGDINAYGFTEPTTSAHPTAAAQRLGFSQNWAGATASTIAEGSIGWSQYAPYVGLGVGMPPPTPYLPQQTPFLANGTHTLPPWLVAGDLVDLAGVGGGGGGEGELGVSLGSGGLGGSWATKTLVVGTDIAPGGTITITVGDGGAGSPYFTAGLPGTATIFEWTNPTTGTQTLTCAGGLGGSASTNITSWGLPPSPGTLSFEDQNYFGGALITNGVGNAPGGGGSGAGVFEFGFAGAPGQAWTVDRQS